MREGFERIRARAAWLVVSTVAFAGCQSKQERYQTAIKSQEERVALELKAAGFPVNGAVSCPNFHLLEDKFADWIRCGVDLEGDDPQLYEIAVRKVTGTGHNPWQVKRATLGVDKEKLQAEAERWLAAHPQTHPVDSVHCDQHLMGVTGDSIRCRLRLKDGRSVGITSTLEGIEGGLHSSPLQGTVGTSTAVRYRQDVDAAPEAIAALAFQRLRDRKAIDPGRLADAAVSCDDFLEASVGASVRCRLLEKGRATHNVVITYREFDRKADDARLDVALLPVSKRG